MGEVVKLIRGRQQHGKSLPKPVECKDCGEDIETARLQAVPHTARCISCERAAERRLDRHMQAIQAHQAVKIL